jgi:hypothetical protein
LWSAPRSFALPAIGTGGQGGSPQHARRLRVANDAGCHSLFKKLPLGFDGGQRRDRSFHGCCGSVSYRKHNVKKSENSTSPGSAVQNWYTASTLRDAAGSGTSRFASRSVTSRRFEAFSCHDHHYTPRHTPISGLILKIAA